MPRTVRQFPDDSRISFQRRRLPGIGPRKLPSLGTIRESYALDPATGELVLEMKVTGSRLPRGIEMRRVYQPEGEK